MSEILTPLRFREVAEKLLITNEVGDYGVFDLGVVERLLSGSLTDPERRKLTDLSILIEAGAEWRLASLMNRVQKGSRSSAGLTYLIVIPTLRCDLSCTYCQVSRAPIDAKGFDWSKKDVEAFGDFLGRSVAGDKVKIEFQGGEPTLRPDVIQQVIDLATQRFQSAEFAICTNLTRIDPAMEEIFAREDVVVSTSIDGSLASMVANRTADNKVAQDVFRNLDYLRTRYGPEKVAALPTITDAQISAPRDLIDTYVSLGFESIFLRPVNYMGFARKRFERLSGELDRWARFYREALAYIVEINKDRYFEEFYMSLLVKSIFARIDSGFVDFRSPSRFLNDYCVIDFDGSIYPSDEARMLSRTKHVDLSVGNLQGGVDPARVRDLNFHAVNQVNPDCLHCVYMPHCGVDIVDDISRYGRVDVPKQDTWFCGRQMLLLDIVFEKIIEKDRTWTDVFLKWIFRNPGLAHGFAVLE